MSGMGMVMGCDVAPAAAGQTHYSVLFDGVNGLLTLPAGIVMTGSLTLSMWLKPTSGSPASTNIPFYGVSAGTSDFLVLGLLTSGNLQACGFANASDCKASSGTLTSATWVHVAVTKALSGVGQVQKIYVNGSDVTAAASSFFSGGHNANLIADDFTTGSLPLAPWAGKVAESALFSSILSGANIAGIAAGTTDPLSLSPLALWRFTEDAGTSVGDSSGNGYTGTLSGGATWSTDKPSELS